MADSTFTVRVDDDLKEAFTTAAKSADRTGGQLVRDFMRAYVADRQDYEAWLKHKVDKGLKAARAGKLLSQEEVDARAENRKKRILKQAKARAR